MRSPPHRRGNTVEAVALFLGHRASVDFDFFTHLCFQPDDVLKRFHFLRGAEILESRPDTLTVLVRSGDGDADRVKISFFGGLDFGRLADARQTPDGVLTVAAPEDLLAHKLKVLMQRIEARDYQDIDGLLASGLDLATGLGGAQALFPAFSPQECLKALTYFEGDALRDLQPVLRSRLVNAAKRVRSVPRVAVKARTLGGS